MNDISATQVAFTIILSVEFILGNLGNGFIALVNCRDWAKRRKVSSVDQILIALAISRIGLLLSVIMTVLAFIFYPDLLMTSQILRLINITCTVTNHFNMWLATCLSIFYVLKIAIFSNSVFLYLKYRVEKVVLVTLAASGVVLLLNVVLTNRVLDFWVGEHQRNMSHGFTWWKFSRLSHPIFFLNYMLTLIPFIVSLPPYLLLVFSLWKHLSRMQHQARDASTVAHATALKTGLAFLLLYTAFLLCVLVQVSSFRFLESKLIILFAQAIGMSFPSWHSWVLIFGNSKLRQASLSLLSWLRSRFQEAESLDL